MKNKLSKSIVLIISIGTQAIYSLGDVKVGDFNICTNVCAGNNVSCKSQSLKCGSTHEESSLMEELGLNSYADTSLKLYDWKTEDLTSDGLIIIDDIVNIAFITSDTNYEFQFPANGKKKILAFTPTEGKIAGKEIEIMFASIDLMGKKYPAGTPQGLKDEIELFKKENPNNPIVYSSQVRVLGRRAGETKWYDAGKINLNFKPNAKGFMVTLTVHPNGIVEINQGAILNQVGTDGTTKKLQSIVLDFTVMM